MNATAVRFQALPPLSPDEYRALEESVLAHGILVPIIVDEHGVVIDGHHRQKIAREHDLPCPREVKAMFTDTEKRTMALSLNIDRRHLTREQRRGLLEESLKVDPQLSDREHGRRTGVDHKTAGAVRCDLETRGEIPHAEQRSDSLGRQQPSSKPRPVRRKPLTDEARDLSLDIGRVTKRLGKLVDDDRFHNNVEDIGCRIRPQIEHGLALYQRVNAAINPTHPPDVLHALVDTLTSAAVACQFIQPDEVTQQHIERIRECLDAIHDAVESWEVVS